jgi:hypothetical protein
MPFPVQSMFIRQVKFRLRIPVIYEVTKLFSRLRLKKKPPSAGISNEEQGTPNIEGRRRFASYFKFKRNRAFGAPSFDIRHSLFGVQSSHILFFLSFFTYSNYVQHVGR